MNLSPLFCTRACTFTDAIEQQARARPQALAVVTEGSSLTFAQLQARASSVASYLLRRGVTRESRIGLYMQRGEDPLETLIFLLGILKVAAYVPLNAKVLPPRRLAFVFHDARISLLLTLERHRSALERAGIPVHAMDTEPVQAELASAESTSLPLPPSAEGDVAYIMYTSGTTGNPKGVIVRQRSLAHFATVQNERLGIGPGDRLSQFFSLSFDASLSEISGLAAGATLYPVPATALFFDPELVQFLRDNQITVATSTPSLWKKLLPLLDHGRPLANLRLLVLGGEQCTSSLLQLTWQRQPTLRVFNACGLTETTVAYALGECTTNDRFPTVGRPFEGIAVTVRDETLATLLPANEIGQICVSGEECLALGYTDPVQTAERFVPDPRAPGERLFLTRDAGFRDEQGRIAIVERIDQESRLKLPGGLLVDLREIEALLARLSRPRVRESAVEHFDGLIVAYLALYPEELDAFAGTTPQERAQVAERELFSTLDHSLRELVPDYMLPLAYVICPELPLTDAAKIDRGRVRALPVDWQARFKAEASIPARTVLEREVSEVVAQMYNALRRKMDDALKEAGLGATTQQEQSLCWQDIDVSLSPQLHGIKSVQSTDFVMAVERRCGVTLPLTSLALPIRLIAQSMAYLQSQQHEEKEEQQAWRKQVQEEKVGGYE